VANKYKITDLNRKYNGVEEKTLNAAIAEVFKQFRLRNKRTLELIEQNDVHSALLNIVNSFDHYAQFYKGVVPNDGKKKDKDFVKCLGENCCKVCCSRKSVYYKCRAGGSRPMQLDKLHYSSNGKWEEVKVGETYTNFLKNSDIPNKRLRDSIYDIRCKIDHSGFYSIEQVEIKDERLIFKKCDLLELLQNSLQSYQDNLQKEINTEKEIVKTSRVIRFLDHLYYLYNNDQLSDLTYTEDLFKEEKQCTHP
jgi:hypothetical protein